MGGAIKALWRWISPSSNKKHGSYEAAMEEALADVRESFEEQIEQWGGRANFHLVLTIEPLEDDQIHPPDHDPDC